MEKNFYVIWQKGPETPVESPVLNQNGLSAEEAETFAAQCREEGETVLVSQYGESPYWRLAWR